MLNQIREVAFYPQTTSRHHTYPLRSLQLPELQLSCDQASTYHLSVGKTVFLQKLVRTCLPMRKIRSVRHLPSSCPCFDPGWEVRTAVNNDWWVKMDTVALLCPVWTTSSIHVHSSQGNSKDPCTFSHKDELEAFCKAPLMGYLSVVLSPESHFPPVLPEWLSFRYSSVPHSLLLGNSI